MAEIPSGYRQLAGSERKVRKGAKRVGPADPKETLSVSIYLRRRADAPPLPTQEHFVATPLSQRQPLSRAELGERQGASPEDIKVVTDFAQAAGLKIVQTDPARRLVQVSGTVAQLSKAFSVELALYRSA